MSESRAYKLYFDPLKAEFSLLGIPAIEVESKIRHYVINDNVTSIVPVGQSLRLFSPLEIDGHLEINGEYSEILSSEASSINETISTNCLFSVPSRHQVNLVTGDLVLDGFLELDGEIVEV